MIKKDKITGRIVWWIRGREIIEVKLHSWFTMWVGSIEKTVIHVKVGNQSDTTRIEGDDYLFDTKEDAENSPQFKEAVFHYNTVVNEAKFNVGQTFIYVSTYAHGIFISKRKVTGYEVNLETNTLFYRCTDEEDQEHLVRASRARNYESTMDLLEVELWYK